MHNTDSDEENDWIGLICNTGEKCLRTGYWKQRETNKIIWHEVDDLFPELECTPTTYERATYEYIGKTKGN